MPNRREARRRAGSSRDTRAANDGPLRRTRAPPRTGSGHELLCTDEVALGTWIPRPDGSPFRCGRAETTVASTGRRRRSYPRPDGAGPRAAARPGPRQSATAARQAACKCRAGATLRLARAPAKPQEKQDEEREDGDAGRDEPRGDDTLLERGASDGARSDRKHRATGPPHPADERHQRTHEE